MILALERHYILDERVIDDWLIAIIRKFLANMGTDEAGSTCNENIFHIGDRS